MTIKQEILEVLGGFSGADDYYKHGTINLTNGVFYLAKSAEAFWLLDIIDSLRFCKKVKNESFVVFNLTVDTKRTKKQKFDAIFTADDGNGNILYTQKIIYTDFPLNSIKLYFQNNVLMLPGEY